MPRGHFLRARTRRRQRRRRQDGVTDRRNRVSHRRCRATGRVRPRPRSGGASPGSRPRKRNENDVTPHHIGAGGDVTTTYMLAAAGRAVLSADDLRSPASANLSMNRTPRDWFAPVTDPTSATSTVSSLEAANGSPPDITAEAGEHTGGPRGFEGGMREPPRARGFQRGTRPGGPLWSRRRRSPQLDGLKSGQRRHRRRRQGQGAQRNNQK